jgi:hypothetical protein
MKRVLYLVPALLLPLAQANAEDKPPDKPPVIEYEFPAPGCPAKLATYDSLSDYCRPLDQKRSCNAESKCEWSDESTFNGVTLPASCLPKEGTFLAMRALPPTPATPLPDFMQPLDLPDLTIEGTPQEKQAAKIAASAYDAAVAKQYDRAIQLYIQALKLNSAVGANYFYRGLLYEYKADPKKALVDYCDGLSHGLSWGPQELADKRIAQLTQPGAEKTPLPTFMSSGVIRLRKRAPAIAPFKVETPEEADYLLKLVNVQDDGEEMLIYVRGGSTYETKVPLGTYHIRGASGAFWYGEKDLFGEETSYFKLSDSSGLDDEFKFERKGNQVEGYSLKLIKQRDGNLDTKPIDRGDF